MTTTFTHTYEFNLNKAHFNECYGESVNADYSLRAYFKAIVFALLGMGLVMFTPIDPYAGWFVFALGIVEALSVYYQKPWWVLRQLLSKAANSQVTLTINDKHIEIKSYYVEQLILWNEVDSVIPTSLGWLIKHNNATHYLSNSHLSAEVIQFLKSINNK